MHLGTQEVATSEQPVEAETARELTRLEAVDITRGFIMMVMALDHCRGRRKRFLQETKSDQ
jgi:uncharacterized membrane protein